MKEKLVRILRFLKGKPSKAKDVFSQPYRDWHLLIVLSLVLMLCTGIAHYYLYKSYSDSFVPSDVSSGPKLNVSQLDKVAKYIEAKRASYDILLDSSPPNIDPN
ncbi:MAG TPA: hypothetical protein VJJ22_01425 [Candidatus Paceibacterota bacterium]